VQSTSFDKSPLTSLLWQVSLTSLFSRVYDQHVPLTSFLWQVSLTSLFSRVYGQHDHTWLYGVIQRQGRREGGGLPRGPRFWGPLEIFCWAPVIFLEEIFPRKGQDIWFLGESNEIWYENNYIVLVRKNFFPKKLSTGERLSENFFWNRGPWKKIWPGPPPSFWRPWPEALTSVGNLRPQLIDYMVWRLDESTI
jgi:hypothetical protein